MNKRLLVFLLSCPLIAFANTSISVDDCFKKNLGNTRFETYRFSVPKGNYNVETCARYFISGDGYRVIYSEQKTIIESILKLCANSKRTHGTEHFYKTYTAFVVKKLGLEGLRALAWGIAGVKNKIFEGYSIPKEVLEYAEKYTRLTDGTDLKLEDFAIVIKTLNMTESVTNEALLLRAAKDLKWVTDSRDRDIKIINDHYDKNIEWLKDQYSKKK